jgi:hypothetical protein
MFTHDDTRRRTSGQRQLKLGLTCALAGCALGASVTWALTADAAHGNGTVRPWASADQPASTDSARYLTAGWAATVAPAVGVVSFRLERAPTDP